MTGKEEALAALTEADNTVRQLAAQLAAARRQRITRVAEARQADATWDEIGTATGQTRQNAYKHYAHHLDVTVTRTIRPKGTDR